MKTETMQISGMTCGGCVSNVTKALSAVAGVKNATVSLSPGQARVEFDENTTALAQLRTAVQQAGYQVNVSDADSPAKVGCCS